MNIFPFLHWACTNTYVQKGPFCGLCMLPFSYITSFWYMLLGDFLFLVSSGGGLY